MLTDIGKIKGDGVGNPVVFCADSLICEKSAKI
jgi:hypothetical protein